MKHEMMTFELATHFLPKVALKLESLIDSIIDSQSETHPVIHQHALNNCIELLTIVEKPELKSRFLKEFLRVEHMLNRCNTKISNDLYDQLFQQIQYLSRMNNIFAHSLNDDLFLLASRHNLVANNQMLTDFCPQLQFWIEADPSIRKEMIEKWINALHPLYKTVKTYLAILRQAALFTTIKLDYGFYQQALPPANNCHLIVVKLDKYYGAIPKINLGHFGLSIRLFEIDTMKEMRKDNTKIDLALCQL